MGILGILDLSFTKIKVLPSSISCLAMLRMLLLIGCDLLEEIQHMGSLVQLEVLNASGCSSLRSIESGSFDCMVLLKVLDLSETSITMLTSITASVELRHLHLQGCAFMQSELPYGVFKSGAVINLQLGSIENLAYWMDMLWLPCGLTFQLSDRSGMQVSFDINGDGKTYVYADDAHFFNSLGEDSSLWFNCFQKFQIVVSLLMDDQTRDIDDEVMKTDSIFQNSYFRTEHFSHSIDPDKYLELNGIIGIPPDLDGIVCHAEVISLKRLTITAEFPDLNLRSMDAVRELWAENCNQLETLLSEDEVQALSARGNLHKVWISNTENLLSFCKGVKDMASFSCLKHLLLDCCPNLMCIFPSALRFPDLETSHIKFCDILERVFDSQALGEDSLPRLQLLLLWELHELTSVCSGVLPSLKNLKVRG
jgi:disease resistance protein RPS2